MNHNLPVLTPRRRLIVFTGPSISHARAALLLPNAEMRPPVRRADLEEFAEADLVAIIDGVFDAERAVSPREIRDALARGVRVVGSSSMGALRAVEVPDMIGVGKVFEMYRSGELQRDDEVAVLLDRETSRALTEPLVNVRFAVARLVSEGSLDADRAQAIISAASSLHFHDRTYPNILRRAGLSEVAGADVLSRALRGFDLKCEDAITLLERLEELGSDGHWLGLERRAPEAGDSANAPAAQLPWEGEADAPVCIWESGELIPFLPFLDFLAASGKLHAVARRALFRFLAAGGSVQASARAAEELGPAIDDIAATWGWRTNEEIHVTLADLGFSRRDITHHLLDEQTAYEQVRSMCEARHPEFLRCLRFELLLDDVALKREALRYGALLWLARQAHDEPVSPSEMNEARRAYLCGRPEATWAAMEWESGSSSEQLMAPINLLARARRLMGVAPGTRVASGSVRAVVPAISPESMKAVRLSEPEASEATRGIAARIGVTRVAHVGELERFGLFVTSAYRASSWSSTVGSGKAVTAEGAEVGCVMEEVEKYCQERFSCPIVERASFVELKPDAIAATAFDLPYDTRYLDSVQIEWTEATDLVAGNDVRVPATLFSYVRTMNDPLYSPRRGSRIFSSSGLAAGFALPEALVHGISEVVERHAIRLAEIVVSNPGKLPGVGGPRYDFVDLMTCPESTRGIVLRIREAGYEVRVMDITSSIAVPAFAVRMMTPRGLHGVDTSWQGFCAHPNAEQAINRALMEAVQSRVTHLSGAREDFALKARSLGRHERPRPESTGDAYWWRPFVPKKRFEELGGLLGGSIGDALSYLCNQVVAAGFDRILYRDLSCQEALPARVVRVVIPGVETINPFFTGKQARTLLVADLMQWHEW